MIRLPAPAANIWLRTTAPVRIRGNAVAEGETVEVTPGDAENIIAAHRGVIVPAPSPDQLAAASVSLPAPEPQPERASRKKSTEPQP